MKFKISARKTRGGYRGVAILDNGVVALKTVPVFRSEADAKTAVRAWLSKRGAEHSDRRIPYRERKNIPKKFFALPERAPGRGSLPLADPKKGWRLDPIHVKNAASRLAQMINRGSVTHEEARRAEHVIMRAACELGIERTCERLMAKEHVHMAAYSRRNSRGRYV